jgi:hypothetical protein
MKKPIKAEIIVKQSKIGVMRVGNVDYISLTDLAKYQNSSDPSFTVKNWLRRIGTIDYIGLWEQLRNKDFNLVEFDQIKTQYGKNSFAMSPTQWARRTHATGIISKGGKYSLGTFAHPDIAFEFASWISPEFRLYLVLEFERLKADESYRNQIEWSSKRELAKTNYAIHTDAIKQNLVPILTEKQKKFVYADEADVLNVALFGQTAKEWREHNPELDGNIRDYADVLHLVVLINLENLNAEMINDGISQRERLEKLNSIVQRQLTLLSENQHIKRLDKENTK